MDGFLRFYKQFPRFFLSFLFLFVLYCTVTGQYIFSYAMYANLWKAINPNAASSTNSGITQYINSGNGVMTGFVLFFSCIMISTVGAILLHLIVEGGKYLTNDVMKCGHRICKVKNEVGSFEEHPGMLKRAFLPYECLAMYFMRCNEVNIFYYLQKKSLAQKEILSTYRYYYPKYQADITKYFEGLHKAFMGYFIHTPKPTKYEIVRHYDYFSSVSQEQLKRDSIRGDVDNYLYFLLICFITMLNSVLFSRIPAMGCLAWYSFAGLFYFTLIAVGDKRWFLASYILYGYLDVFLFGESASVTDRDSN